MSGVLLLLSALVAYAMMMVSVSDNSLSSLSAHSLLFVPWSMAFCSVVEKRAFQPIKKWTVVIGGGAIFIALLWIVVLYRASSMSLQWTIVGAQLVGCIAGGLLMKQLIQVVRAKARFQQLPWMTTESALVLSFWFLSLVLPLWADWRLDLWLQQWRSIFSSGIALWQLPQAIAIGFLISTILRERDNDIRQNWEYLSLLLLLQALGGVLGQAFGLTQWLGLLGGFVLTLVLPLKSRDTFLFTLFFAVTLMMGFKPLMLLSQAKAFHWQPFWGLIDSAPGMVVQSLAGKIFWCSALIWVANRQEMSRRLACIVVTLWFTGIEFTQRYLVAQTPELNEIIWAPVLAYVFFSWSNYWAELVKGTGMPARDKLSSVNQDKASNRSAS